MPCGRGSLRLSAGTAFPEPQPETPARSRLRQDSRNGAPRTRPEGGLPKCAPGPRPPHPPARRSPNRGAARQFPAKAFLYPEAETPITAKNRRNSLESPFPNSRTAGSSSPPEAQGRNFRLVLPDRENRKAYSCKSAPETRQRSRDSGEKKCRNRRWRFQRDPFRAAGTFRELETETPIPAKSKEIPTPEIRGGQAEITLQKLVAKIPEGVHRTAKICGGQSPKAGEAARLVSRTEVQEPHRASRARETGNPIPVTKRLRANFKGARTGVAFQKKAKSKSKFPNCGNGTSFSARTLHNRKIRASISSLRSPNRKNQESRFRLGKR